MMGANPVRARVNTTERVKMAKKADLIQEAKNLGLKVTEKNTIAEIEAKIKEAKVSTKEIKEEVKETSVAEKVVTEETEVTEVTTEKTVAKAGKRSAKSLAEAEEKAEKEARKEAGDTTPQSEGTEAAVKKGPKPITRSRLERRGKAYQQAAKKIEADKLYTVADAIELATQTSPSKFDASVEVHTRLGVDPRQADQNVRATVQLPHGTGKKITVAVFAPEAELAVAKEAGADIVGDEEFLQQLEKEVLNFDVLIVTPQYVPKLAKFARLLGPRGLMPNPKAGTVTTNLTKAVKEAKTGKVEYRVDKQSIVHLGVGKVSFGADKLKENVQVFLDSLNSHKPSSLKGTYVKSVTITTTQGPAIKVEFTNL